MQMWRFAEEFIASSPHAQPPPPATALGASGTAAAHTKKRGQRLFSFPPETVLRFLFQLSYCRVGEDYPVAALTPDEVK